VKQRRMAVTWRSAMETILETAARTRRATDAAIQITEVRDCCTNRDPQDPRQTSRGHGKDGVGGSSPQRAWADRLWGFKVVRRASAAEARLSRRGRKGLPEVGGVAAEHYPTGGARNDLQRWLTGIIGAGRS